MLDWLLYNIQTISLTLIAVFYVAYLAKMLMLRMDGIKGNQLGKGNKPANDRLTEICLQIVTLAGAAVQFVCAVFPDWVKDRFGIMWQPVWE